MSVTQTSKVEKPFTFANSRPPSVDGESPTASATHGTIKVNVFPGRLCERTKPDTGSSSSPSVPIFVQNEKKSVKGGLSAVASAGEARTKAHSPRQIGDVFVSRRSADGPIATLEFCYRDELFLAVANTPEDSLENAAVPPGAHRFATATPSNTHDRIVFFTQLPSIS
jgi:hypothetical protein